MNPLDIREILALPQQHRATVAKLNELYNYIKDTWTLQAITELRDKHNINLRTTLGKCQLARLAGEIELSNTKQDDTSNKTSKQDDTSKPVDSSESVTLPEQSKEAANKQLHTTKILISVIGLLLPGKELNGRQLTPAFRVFGMATTKDMLRHNYRLLRKIEHPDVSKYSLEIANARYAFVTKLYRVLSSNWEDKYDPTLPLTKEVLSKAMDVKLPFPACSFKIN